MAYGMAFSPSLLDRIWDINSGPLIGCGENCSGFWRPILRGKRLIVREIVQSFSVN